jgi:hypothetical protein
MSAVKRTYDDIARSEEDKRCYRGLELNNGLKVIFSCCDTSLIITPHYTGPAYIRPYYRQVFSSFRCSYWTYVRPDPPPRLGSLLRAHAVLGD